MELYIKEPLGPTFGSLIRCPFSEVEDTLESRHYGLESFSFIWTYHVLNTECP